MQKNLPTLHPARISRKTLTRNLAGIGIALAAQCAVAAIEAPTPEAPAVRTEAQTLRAFGYAAYELFWLRENWPDSPRIEEIEGQWPLIDDVYHARDFAGCPDDQTGDFDIPDELEGGF